MAVVGVLVDAQIGHQHHPIADVGGKIARGTAARFPQGRRPSSRWNPWWKALRTGSRRRRRGRRARRPRRAGCRACAARRPAATRSVAARRCPRGRTVAPRGCATSRRVSATRSRRAADVRSRRGRETGKLPATNGHRRPLHRRIHPVSEDNAAHDASISRRPSPRRGDVRRRAAPAGAVGLSGDLRPGGDLRAIRVRRVIAGAVRPLPAACRSPTTIGRPPMPI